jgi:peroxiredoxin
MRTAVLLAMAVFGVMLLSGCPHNEAPPTTPNAAAPTGPASPTPAAPQAAQGVKLLPGDQKPEFTAKGVDGKDVKPSDYSGKILVMDFWATWCAPCCKKLKEYQPMSAKYQDQGVQFLVMSLDDTPETAKGWAKANNITIPMAMFDDSVQSIFFPGEKSVTIPQVRILDSSGGWRYSMDSSSKVSDVEDAIKTLLAEKK